MRDFTAVSIVQDGAGTLIIDPGQLGWDVGTRRLVGIDATLIAADDFLTYLSGTEYDDRLTGGGDDEYLFGGEGDDIISDGGGGDTGNGGAGDDELDGGRGNRSRCRRRSPARWRRRPPRPSTARRRRSPPVPVHRCARRYDFDLHLRHDRQATEAFAETHVRRLEAIRRAGGAVTRDSLDPRTTPPLAGRRPAASS